MAIVTMRYWAAAKDAAGVPEQQVSADTLAAALAQACETQAAETQGPAGCGRCWPGPPSSSTGSRLAGVQPSQYSYPTAT